MKPLTSVLVPLGALMIAMVMSPRYQRVYGIAVALTSIGFLVGATIAVVTDHGLY